MAESSETNDRGWLPLPAKEYSKVMYLEKQ